MSVAEVYVAGYTGTRNGMTSKQRLHVRVLVRYVARVLHHGDCVGGDEEMHVIAKDRGLLIFVHPPIDPSLRAFCKGDFAYPQKEHLVRNREIVHSVEWLIAAPATMLEEVRSGTWATVRYARKIGRPLSIVFPDGSVSHERPIIEALVNHP